MIARARRAAYAALRSVSAGTSDLAHAIVVNRDALGDERDRAPSDDDRHRRAALAERLDWPIVRAARRDLRKLDAEVLDILRLGLFLLLFLTRVPQAAVVDDSVKLTRVVGKSSAAGLVNGIEASSRTRSALELPAILPAGDDVSRDHGSTRSASRGRIRAGSSPGDRSTVRPSPRRGSRVQREAGPTISRRGCAGRPAGEPCHRPLRFAPDGLSISRSLLRTSLADRGEFVHDETCN